MQSGSGSVCIGLRLTTGVHIVSFIHLKLPDYYAITSLFYIYIMVQCQMFILNVSC